jgi:Holliday junction resolvase RusA-like endonuclease
MSVLRFVIPGEPRGKGRPRFGKSRAGFVSVRTDDKTAAYENLVKLAARQAGAVSIAGPLSVQISAYFVPPPSWSKKRRAAALAGHEAPGRFDIDNISKAVLDGLNGIAFGDDKQIVTLFARKAFADVARCEVQVFPCVGINERSAGSQQNTAAQAA